MKKNILVFPCGSEIGLEVYRSLAFSTHVNLFGGSSVKDHGMFVYKNYIGNLPHIDSSAFIKELNHAVKEHSIDFIFPTHDSVVLKLAQESSAGKLSCPVITSPAKTCELARSKLKTYRLLGDVIRVPKVHESIDDITDSDLPIFLKPDVGQGTKGTYLAKTMDDLIFYANKDRSLLQLEYLPGKEYTVDCFTDKDNRLLFCEGRERIRVLNGISVSASTVEDDRFRGIAEKISQQVVFRGAWFFQVKENINNELTLLEIAPRIAGTMALVRSRGVNLPLLSLFDALDQPVEIVENGYDIIIDRALENKYKHNIQYRHAYIDFDDLIVFDKFVNPTVIAFIFQCINKGVKVHLLTRHKEDLDSNLKKYRLTHLFDELIWVGKDDEKYLHIKEKDAIFIDDSFAERKKISQKCHIPVFDANMIECLMEG